MNTIKKHLNIYDNETSNKVDEYLKYIIIRRGQCILAIEKGEIDYRKIKK